MSDSTSRDELASSLARIPTNYLVVPGGDFNLPDWDWSTGTPILILGCKHSDQHTKLNDIIDNHGFIQHITDPTRLDRTHTMAIQTPLTWSWPTVPVLWSHPAWFLAYQTTMELSLNWISNQSESQKTQETFLCTNPLYGKMRKASRNVSTQDQAASLRTSFYRLKSHIQADTHKAYWNYIATVILPQGGSGTLTKSFWSFLRWHRTEKMSILALKSSTTGNLVNNAVGKAEILNSL